MDFTDYRPAPEVLQRLRQVCFIAVVGPTAAGKNTVMSVAMARDPRLHFVLDTTSREARPGEQEGQEFTFRPREEMLARIARREYVQVAPSVFGDIYATAPEHYHPQGISMMPVLAQAVPAFRALPFKACRTVFVLPPSFAAWRQRLAAHNFTPEKLARRLQEARTSLQFCLQDAATHIIVNDQLPAAAEDFLALLNGQPLPPHLQTAQTQARTIAQELLAQLPKP